MDLDADAKLNLKEFIDAVRPIENFTTKKVANPSSLSSQKRRPRSSIGMSQGRNANKFEEQQLASSMQNAHEYFAGAEASPLQQQRGSY